MAAHGAEGARCVMTDAARVLLVEPPGRYRDALERAVSAHGAQAEALDDGMALLAGLPQVSAGIVVVGDGAGPPGAASLCRIVQRHLGEARVYRLGEDPSASEPGDVACLPRDLPAALLAARILAQEPAAAGEADGFALSLGAYQVGQLLLGLCRQRATGRLYLVSEAYERQLDLVRGVAVASAGGPPSERLGAVALAAGMVEPAQLTAALHLCETTDLRLGQALCELQVLDALGRFRLLCEQHLRRVAAACAEGPLQARFAPRPELSERAPLLPVHPLTALLRSFQAVPVAARAGFVQRLSARQLVRGSAGVEVQACLAALGLAEVAAQLSAPSTVAALREGLQAALGDGERPDADSLLLSLVGSGAVALGRGATRSSLPPSTGDSLRGLSGLSLLQVPELLVAPDPAPDWVAALDRFLHPEGAQARAFFLEGAVADAPATAEAAAFYLDVMAARGPHTALGVSTRTPTAQLRLAYFAALDRVDLLWPGADDGAPGQARRRQLRRVLERAGGELPNLELEPSSVGVDVTDVTGARPGRTPDAAAVPTGGQVAAAPPAAAGRPPPPPPPTTALAQAPANRQQRSDPPGPGVPDEVESIVQQTRWQALIEFVEARGEPVSELPPALALLYAIALKEAQDLTQTGATSPDAIGIDAVAKLLHVGEDSPTALVVAKRVLRKRPLEWAQQPTRKVSVVAVVLALAVGAVVGLLLNALGLF